MDKKQKKVQKSTKKEQETVIVQEPVKKETKKPVKKVVKEKTVAEAKVELAETAVKELYTPKEQPKALKETKKVPFLKRWYDRIKRWFNGRF